VGKDLGETIWLFFCGIDWDDKKKSGEISKSEPTIFSKTLYFME
jgi:hypothetical protein